MGKGDRRNGGATEDSRRVGQVGTGGESSRGRRGNIDRSCNTLAYTRQCYVKVESLTNEETWVRSLQGGKG